MILIKIYDFFWSDTYAKSKENQNANGIYLK